jgi:hypothetical protein
VLYLLVIGFQNSGCLSLSRQYLGGIKKMAGSDDLALFVAASLFDEKISVYEVALHGFLVR